MNKLLLTAFLFSFFSTVIGQNIQFNDLKGEWTMDTGRNVNTLHFDFINESTYSYSSEKDTTLGKDHYELKSKDHESILTLYKNSGTYVMSRRFYLIRKINSVSFKLQIPETNQFGEIISFEWGSENKKNTFILYRMERHVDIVN
jgi:hypothetical protein